MEGTGNPPEVSVEAQELWSSEFGGQLFNFIIDSDYPNKRRLYFSQRKELVMKILQLIADTNKDAESRGLPLAEERTLKFL